MASASLWAAGIENNLADTCTIGLVWTYSTALGWIRLSVEDRQLEEAREFPDSRGTVDWPVELAAGPAELCPMCGADDLALERGSRKTLALALAAVGALTVLTACPPQPPPDAVFVHAAPPPAPTPTPSFLNIAEADSDRSEWISGFYRWNGSEYVWVPGHREKPPHPGTRWVNGLWAHNGNGWYWVEGYWR